MLFVSPHFKSLDDAQKELAVAGFLLLDIHQVLFHRRGILPLLRGIARIQKKSLTFGSGIAALLSRKTWASLKARYQEGNRITESYLNATRQYAHLHSELLNYSNAIYTADDAMHGLLTKLKNKGHELYLLSNIGNNTFERLKQAHPDFFELMTQQTNSINRHAAVTGTEVWKPQHSAYQESLTAIDKLTTPHHAIFIDDTPRNVRAAHQAGMNAILFTSFTQCRKDLQALLGENDL